MRSYRLRIPNRNHTIDVHAHGISDSRQYGHLSRTGVDDRVNLHQAQSRLRRNEVRHKDWALYEFVRSFDDKNLGQALGSKIPDTLCLRVRAKKQRANLWHIQLPFPHSLPQKELCAWTHSMRAGPALWRADDNGRTRGSSNLHRDSNDLHSRNSRLDKIHKEVLNTSNFKVRVNSLRDECNSLGVAVLLDSKDKVTSSGVCESADVCKKFVASSVIPGRREIALEVEVRPFYRALSDEPLEISLGGVKNISWQSHGSPLEMTI
jgi:hypothetical protein